MLNFVVAFNVTNSGPLKITAFGFFNDNACFARGLNGQTESGNASFTTDATGHVTGTLSLTITSSHQRQRADADQQSRWLDRYVERNDHHDRYFGSNGEVAGTWTLAPGANASGCNPVTKNDGATFVMCQNKACSTAQYYDSTI